MYLLVFDFLQISRGEETDVNSTDKAWQAPSPTQVHAASPTSPRPEQHSASDQRQDKTPLP